MTWTIRQPRPARGRQHVLDAAQACKVCGMPAAAIAVQTGEKICDGGAALRRRAADQALIRAIARSR